MKFPRIDGSMFFNITIIIISGFVAWFCLLMGAAHIIEGILHPNYSIPIGEQLLGGAFCVGLCIIGLISLWVAIGATIGVVNRFKNRGQLH